jgi:hypothetical protein
MTGPDDRRLSHVVTINVKVAGRYRYGIRIPGSTENHSDGPIGRVPIRPSLQVCLLKEHSLFVISALIAVP